MYNIYNITNYYAKHKFFLSKTQKNKTSFVVITFQL